MEKRHGMSALTMDTFKRTGYTLAVVGGVGVVAGVGFGMGIGKLYKLSDADRADPEKVRKYARNSSLLLIAAGFAAGLAAVAMNANAEIIMGVIAGPAILGLASMYAAWRARQRAGAGDPQWNGAVGFAGLLGAPAPAAAPSSAWVPVGATA